MSCSRGRRKLNFTTSILKEEAAVAIKIPLMKRVKSIRLLKSFCFVVVNAKSCKYFLLPREEKRGMCQSFINFIRLISLLAITVKLSSIYGRLRCRRRRLIRRSRRSGRSSIYKENLPFSLLLLWIFLFSINTNGILNVSPGPTGAIRKLQWGNNKRRGPLKAPVWQKSKQCDVIFDDRETRRDEMSWRRRWWRSSPVTAIQPADFRDDFFLEYFEL